MKIVKTKISLLELKHMAQQRFGNLVKAVVDVEKERMAVDGELHADEEALLLERGSKQSDLWGVNIYPDLKGDDFIEFDSVINIRPSAGNNSRGIKNAKIRQKIIEIIAQLIKNEIPA